MDTKSAASTPAKRPRANKNLVFVGSFTTSQRKARGKGIDVYRVDPRSAAWESTDHVGGLINPSYLLADPRRNVLYAAHGDAEFASSYAIEPLTGRLRPLGQAATGGKNGVSLAMDPLGHFVVVANYASGTVAVLPVKPDGSLGDYVHCLKLPGPVGPHRTEQTMSHPHHTAFDPSGRFLLVPDKGLDRVQVLALDGKEGRLSVVSQATMRAGAGPRHIAFHPIRPRAFVINEIDSTVTTCSWDAEAGRLTPLHIVPILAPTFFDVSTAAEIVVSACGRFVYASNRGQDAVTRLTLDPSGDSLSVTGWTPTEGREPRFMTLTPKGNCLLVANEQGDDIAAFAIDAKNGALQLTRVISTASPSTIVFL